MEAGFRQNAMSYLLVLRLVPLFPFFLVNLVPAFLGVRLSTFVVATFFAPFESFVGDRQAGENGQRQERADYFWIVNNSEIGLAAPIKDGAETVADAGKDECSRNDAEKRGDDERR